MYRIAMTVDHAGFAYRADGVGADVIAALDDLRATEVWGHFGSVRPDSLLRRIDADEVAWDGDARYELLSVRGEG